MAASQTMTVEVALPPQQAEAAVYQAFLAAGLSWVVGGNGFMQGKVSAGMRSWGENVQATIGYGPRGAVVTLRSECALPTQVIDWGKNLSLIHISEPTRRTPISYAVFCLK